VRGRKAKSEKRKAKSEKRKARKPQEERTTQRALRFAEKKTDVCVANCNFDIHRTCNNVTCSLYVVHCKGALNSGEAQQVKSALP
jgi:hypothetical protein